MTSKSTHVGIDVCSGPSLTRAERLAQEAARFAPPPPRNASPATAKVPVPDPRLPAGE